MKIKSRHTKARSGHGAALIGCRISTEGSTPLALSNRLRNFIHLVPVVAAAVPLAGCNQTMPVVEKSDLSAANRMASLEGGRPMAHRRVAIRTIKHTPYKRTAQIPPTSYGIASFYSDDQLTANGEKFNPKAMTAAHPTLPFGTRLRVTNLATGRFVTVRINDRGPYVHGRVVDVSVSAAESLGIVDRGIAKVKLDVVN